MPKFVVQWDYVVRNVVLHKQGDVIEIEKELADWMNRDSPGVLIPVKEAKGTRSLKSPKKDRMVKSTAGDRGGHAGSPVTQSNFGVMTKADFKAVKGD